MANKIHANITTTIFWVGEESDASNAFISNFPNAWDSRWLLHYGGIDQQGPRSGYLPALFTPKENPFYFALPYNDFDANGVRKANAASIVPWAHDKVWGPNESMVKNHWIKVTGADGKVAYAQWEDAGPLGEDDVAYVFGNAQPSNVFNAHAGLDLSPAMQTYLGLGDIGKTSWQFVDAAAVPDGPWKKTVTTSQLDFGTLENSRATAGNDFLVGTAAANTLNGLAGNDSLFGDAGNDTLIGGLGMDRLNGGSGADKLYGNAGNDIIRGESGNDLIVGGAGADWLWGDEGRDLFVFASIAEIGKGAGLRDRIGDFTPGEDRISLAAIDANGQAAGDAFAWKGLAAFTRHAGELHARYEGRALTIIEGDVNGDGTADFQIELAGHGLLSSASFIL